VGGGGGADVTGRGSTARSPRSSRSSCWSRVGGDGGGDLEGARVARPWSARPRRHQLGPRQPRELGEATSTGPELALGPRGVTSSAAIAAAALATSSRRSTAVCERLAELAAAHRPTSATSSARSSWRSTAPSPRRSCWTSPRSCRSSVTSSAPARGTPCSRWRPARPPGGGGHRVDELRRMLYRGTQIDGRPDGPGPE